MPRLINDSWINAYLAYTAESVSPEEYHIWTAISTIAGTLRRNVFIDMGYFILYPNMYIVLVSPPGRCKKSTAMRMGRDVLNKVPEVNFSSDSTTRERLILDLSTSYKDGQSAMTAHSSEFASLLTNSGMDMVVFLTDIFDCPQEWTHKTKSGGTQTIKAPFLNMQAATTPDWISKAMPLDTVGIGLTSRIVFVYQDTPRPQSHWKPTLSIAQKQLRDVLATDLVSMSNMAGEYHLTEEADELYNEWNIAAALNPNPTGDPRLSGYFERKPIHLLKLAMIVAASNREELYITKDDVVKAMALIEKCESKMPKVFAGVGKNPINSERVEIIEAIFKTDGGLTMGQLVERFSYSLRKDEILEIVEVLMMSGTVKLVDSHYCPVIPD